MKKRDMIRKCTLEENHLFLGASVGFPEELTIELRPEGK